MTVNTQIEDIGLISAMMQKKHHRKLKDSQKSINIKVLDREDFTIVTKQLLLTFNQRLERNNKFNILQPTPSTIDS